MKIPPQAKCVFQGVMFAVYQWDQKLFDGSTAVYEMLKRPDTVNIIASANNKIFIGEQEQTFIGKFIGLFGGRVDEGEEPLAAARRELLEEAGLTTDDWELCHRSEPYDKMEWTAYTYIARNCRKERLPELDAGEKIKVREVSFEEFMEIALSPSFRDTEVALFMARMLSKPGKLAEFAGRIFDKI